ncbi:MAG: DUF2147 domain-containing protein [Flavobacteriales bacterium]|nr:DUF2147 domain-containing protein [Flavobacteriales bacterium]
MRAERSLLLLPLLGLCGVLQAQSILGRWTTVDDKTGKPRSVVEVTERSGKIYGRIVDLYDKSKLQKLCDLCPDDRHNQPVVGLEIIRAMEKDPGSSPGDDEWEDGTILDPESGKVYDCKLWLEDGTLQVRGYVAFLYRTQTWVRER